MCVGCRHYYKKQGMAKERGAPLGFIDIRATQSIETNDPELKKFKLNLPTRTWGWYTHTTRPYYTSSTHVVQSFPGSILFSSVLFNSVVYY